MEAGAVDRESALDRQVPAQPGSTWLNTGPALWSALQAQVRVSVQAMAVGWIASDGWQCLAHSPAWTDETLGAAQASGLLDEPGPVAGAEVMGRLEAVSSNVAGQPGPGTGDAQEWVRLVVQSPAGPRLILRRQAEVPRGPQASPACVAHALVTGSDDAEQVELVFADALLAETLGWQPGQTLGPEDWLRAGLSPFECLQLLCAARGRQACKLLPLAVPGETAPSGLRQHWALNPAAPSSACVGTDGGALAWAGHLQLSPWSTRVRDDAQLRQIQALALRATVNGVVVTDNRLPGNPIVDVNSGFERLTGYRAAEVLGRPCNFLQGNETAQPGRRQIAEALARRAPVTVVLRNFRKDGSAFWNRIEIAPVADPDSGEVTHFMALQTDVTLQHECELAARQRSAELEHLFRQCPLGVVVHDGQGQVRMINPAFEALTGLNAAAHESQSLESLVQTLARECKPDARRPRWPLAGQTLQWLLVRPRRRVLEVAAVDIGALGGELAVERMVFFRDATAEHELRSMKTEFLATTAHEMRAPLASIRGFSELMLVRQVPPTQAREMVEIVFRQAMRLNNLLGDLLELSKIEAQGSDRLSLTPIEPLALAERIVEGLILPGDARVVEVRSSDPSMGLMGHPQKLEQVLLNLLTNALKYSPGGEAVTVQIDPVTDAHGQDWCHIAIEDRGLGLSEEHLGRLFTRFFRADPQSEIPGTGLGLVIVKELVERMGGRIEVSSVLGQGSTFRVCLQQSARSLDLAAASVD